MFFKSETNRPDFSFTPWPSLYILLWLPVQTLHEDIRSQLGSARKVGYELLMILRQLSLNPADVAAECSSQKPWRSCSSAAQAESTPGPLVCGCFSKINIYLWLRWFYPLLSFIDANKINTMFILLPSPRIAESAGDESSSFIQFVFKSTSTFFVLVWTTCTIDTEAEQEWNWQNTHSHMVEAFIVHRLPLKSHHQQYPQLPAGGVTSHSVKQHSSAWRLLVKRKKVDVNVEPGRKQTDKLTDRYSCSVVLDNIHVSEVYIKRATCKKMHWLFVKSSMIQIIPLCRVVGFLFLLHFLGIVFDEGWDFAFFVGFVVFLSSQQQGELKQNRHLCFI